jgi:pilus assembly protein Flp/PilA
VAFSIQPREEFFLGQPKIRIQLISRRGWRMWTNLVKFARDEEGVTSIEYALICLLISIVIVGGATGIGTNLNVAFGKVNTGFTSK